MALPLLPPWQVQVTHEYVPRINPSAFVVPVTRLEITLLPRVLVALTGVIYS